MVIDWSQIPGDVFAHARTLAIVEDHTGIDALIRPNLYRLDAGGRSGEALTVEQVRSFQARGISRTPDVLDRELDAARRRSHSAPDSRSERRRAVRNRQRPKADRLCNSNRSRHRLSRGA